MARNTLNDLLAFCAVATERSFTRAAAQMGVSTSALSHTMRALEERLGVRLLNRTTRSVEPTEAGERLLRGVETHLDGIEAELAALGELRDKPAGTIRITTGAHPARTILEPALVRLLADYPDVKIELSVDAGFVDIVAERFDAGVRLGETVARDMVAVRIGPDMRMAAVASPAYFAAHDQPRTPHDLSRHNCINLRFPTYGGLYAWEFEKDGRALNVRVDGQMAVNDSALALLAARRSGDRLCPRRLGAVADRRKRLGAHTGRLVSAVSRLSSLLSKSPTAFPRFCRADRGASISRIGRRRAAEVPAQIGADPPDRTRCRSPLMPRMPRDDRFRDRHAQHAEPSR